MGTLGGSVANNDPAACYPSAVLGLGATVITTQREIAADDFFQGMFTTALEEGEIITAVRFPIPKRAAYIKFKQPASRFSLIGVFVAQTDAACAWPSRAVRQWCVPPRRAGSCAGQELHSPKLQQP
jgi:carbon-monoxide dehydrogenase medium subunit